MNIMKNFLTTCLIALASWGIQQPVAAQGLFGKISKSLEKVNKALDNAGTKADVALGGSVAQDNGVIMSNPIPQECDIQLVSAIGTSKSENFGDVTLVFKVKLLVPKTKIMIGQGVRGTKPAAFDEDGNQYEFEHASLVGSYEVAEGMYVKVTHEYKIMNVRKSTSKFQLVRCGLRTDWEHMGMMTMKNVPIDWDPQPEQ